MLYCWESIWAAVIPACGVCVCSAAQRDLCTFLHQGGMSEPALEQPSCRGGTACLKRCVLSYEMVSEPPCCSLHVTEVSDRFFPLLLCFILHPLPFSCVFNGASEVVHLMGYQLTCMPPYHTRTHVLQHHSLGVLGLRKQHRSTAAGAEQML